MLLLYHLLSACLRCSVLLLALPGAQFTCGLANEPAAQGGCAPSSQAVRPSLRLKIRICPPPLPALPRLSPDGGICVKSPSCCVCNACQSICWQGRADVSRAGARFSIAHIQSPRSSWVMACWNRSRVCRGDKST